MKRVHRNLSRAEVEALRDRIADSVPQAGADIGVLIKTMRLATRRSQAEYARLCDVTPRCWRRSRPAATTSRSTR